MVPQNKETLKKILKALIPYRNMAEGFLLLLEDSENDDMLNTLYFMISNEIKNIKNNKYKENIKKSLKKIQQQEKKENKKEQDYLEDLIKNI